jgi:hypothetical protein
VTAKQPAIKKYIVKLSGEERDRLTALIQTEVGQFAALHHEVKRVISITWLGAGRDFRGFAVPRFAR